MKSNFQKGGSLLIFAFLFLFGHTQHETYYIGHSGFGWDLIVGEMVNDLAADAGITTYGYGYQFIGGTCISTQWQNHANPQGGTDSHVELATGNYDILVMAEQIPIQEVIYGNPWGCDLRSVQSVDSFVDLSSAANPNMRYYLMEFHNEVDQTGQDPFGDWSALNTSMRPLWEQVADSVSLINPGVNVCIVPVAAAFEAMADSVRAGSFPGITDWIDLFDPNDTVVATIHPTEVTYYLVACVHFATIFGVSPVGLTNQTTAAAGWSFDPPTAAQAAMMQEIAWEIVSNDSRACMPQQNSIVDPGKSGVSVSQDAHEIRIHLQESGKYQIDFFDLSGRKVFSSNSIGADFAFDKQSLPAGLLIFRARSSAIQYSGKIHSW